MRRTLRPVLDYRRPVVHAVVVVYQLRINGERHLTSSHADERQPETKICAVLDAMDKSQSNLLEKTNPAAAANQRQIFSPTRIRPFDPFATPLRDSVASAI
jgi:hypothetical protein